MTQRIQEREGGAAAGWLEEVWRKAVEMWELALAATKDAAVRKRIKDHLLSLL